MISSSEWSKCCTKPNLPELPALPHRLRGVVVRGWAGLSDYGQPTSQARDVGTVIAIGADAPKARFAFASFGRSH
jgi:hypothetical protein